MMMKTDKQEMVKVWKTCPMCGESNTKDFPLEGYRKYNSFGRPLIQDCFPDTPANDREFLKTGYCDDCQAMLIGCVE